MNWFWLAIGAGLGSSAFNFFSRLALRKNGDSSIMGWFFESLRFFSFSLLLVFDYWLIFDFKTFIFLSFLGVSELASVFLFMKMHSLAHLSLSSIIMRLRIVWVPLLALILTGEKLQFNEYLGIIIIFLGVIITASPKKWKKDKAMLVAFMASLVTSVLSLVMKQASLKASTPMVMASMSLPSTFLLPMLMKNFQPRLKKNIKKLFPKALLATFFNLFSMYFLLGSLRIAAAGKVMSIYQAMIIVSVLAGIIVLKERKDMSKRIIGAIITTIGVFILK